MIEENEEEAKPTLQTKLADARSRSAEGRDAGMPHSVATEECRTEAEGQRVTRERHREKTTEKLGRHQRDRVCKRQSEEENVS